MTDRASYHAADTGSDIDVAHDEEPRETLVLLQRTQDVVNKVFTQFHGRQPATHAAGPGSFDAEATGQSTTGQGATGKGADETTTDPRAGRPLAIDLRDVEAALRQEIDLAGLPEQPAPWVNSTAFEIAAGRTVIVDARTV